MGFSLSKLVGKNKNKSTDTVEAIINDVENTPFGVSESNVLYAGLNELGGYYFFQTVIVGQLYIKTMTGAKLILKGEGIELELKSDSSEFESDPTPVKSRSITKIDFQIEEADIKTLQNSRITSIQLKAKKHDILFTKYVSDE
ncbi:hypothetical protein [Winogradskyella jejuensis]|uniref:Uncharacterized protein n=1 Tax=Winogradskyella jejuensis TaxID=1089305 RepID=A0A1M5SN95_9FLAO|nr:hypothetical protein [Winogradskyella jejuensis]SHH39965.1 hypothetical protein SAMN05444148_1916 [Winogradskyella jejuensis]